MTQLSTSASTLESIEWLSNRPILSLVWDHIIGRSRTGK